MARLFGQRRKITRMADFTNLSVQACSFLPNDKAVAIGCKDGQIRLKDLEQHSSSKTIYSGIEFSVPSGEKEWEVIKKIAISPDGRRMAAIREGGRSVWVWDLHTGKNIFSKDLSKSNEPMYGFTQAIALSSDGSRVGIACSIGNAQVGSKYPENYLYDVETGQEMRFGGHQLSVVDFPLDNRINDLDFSSDDNFLISAADDGRAIAWLLDSQGGPQRLVQRNVLMWRVCFSHLGKTFATGEFGERNDSGPLISSSVVGYGEKFKALEVRGGQAHFLAFNRDDSKLLVLMAGEGEYERLVSHRLWVWSEGSTAERVEHNFGEVLAISSDASMVASMMKDTLIIWGLAQILE